MNDNTRKKAALVQEMVRTHYRPERQDRCKTWVWRHVVNKQHPMSERTFWRYLNVKLETEKPKEDEKQLKLF